MPAYKLPGHVRLLDAIKLGRHKDPIVYSPAPDDLAMLQYTGGTSGVAKAALLLHSNLVANALQCCDTFESYHIGEATDSLVLPLPLYHIYAFTMSIVMANTGNHVLLVPNPRDLSSVVKAMTHYPSTMFAGLNTLFVALSNDEAFKRLDFCRFKATTSGGMALTKAAAITWRQVTGCDVYEGYGLTETSPVLTVNRGGAQGNQIGTIGLPVADTEIKIVDDQGMRLPPEKAGELCARGPQVMKGYWKRQQATDEVFDDEGFFLTGDIAVVQDDGYIRIVDRKKDVIIVSGFNVYPNELEEVLGSHEAIIESAVIGVSDEKPGEVPKAFVVVNDTAVDEAAIRTFCQQHLASYKLPRYIEFRDELPKSNVGKILRKDLRH